MDKGLLLFISGLAAFWTVVYALGRGKKGRIEVYPGALLVRAGISLDPMRDGLARRIVIVFGYLSVVLLIVSAALFYYYVLDLFVLKYIEGAGESVAGFSPIIPGVTISWVDSIYIFLAIGIAAFFHELSHAYVSRAVGVRVKDAGIAFFLFVPAAFVEPDEEELKKAPLRSKLPIYSAGVGANILLAILFMFIMGIAASYLASSLVITQVVPGSPAEKAGLAPGMIIVKVNGVPVKTAEELLEQLKKAGIGNKTIEATVNLTVLYNGELRTITVTKPVGVELLGIYYSQLFEHSWLMTFLRASFIINLSLALINAAPLALPLPGGLVFADGGQIVRDVVASKYGEEKGNMAAAVIGVLTLILILSLMTLQRLTL